MVTQLAQCIQTAHAYEDLRMSQQQPQHSTIAQPLPEHHRVGGAVIDEDGREIPITEGMVREACQALETDRRQEAQAAG